MEIIVSILVTQKCLELKHFHVKSDLNMKPFGDDVSVERTEKII